MEIKTVCVAVDGSEVTKEVLDVVATEAQLPSVQRIAVACALPSAVAVADGVMNFPAGAVDEMAQVGKRILEDAEIQLANVSCKVETYLLRGRDAAETLTAFFEEQRCDLVIMGNRGLGGVKGYLGSVSRKVLLHAACPVLIVKG